MSTSSRSSFALPAFRGAGLWVLAGLVAASRWLPHPWNFTPIGGFALLSGATVPGWQRYAAPLLAVLVGDLLLGAYHPLMMLAVYGGHLATVELGRRVLAHRERCAVSRILIVALAASCLFFVLTNAASWWVMYPHDLGGLVVCFTAAVPFFSATLLGNCLYGCAFVKGYEWLLRLRRLRMVGPKHSGAG